MKKLLIFFGILLLTSCIEPQTEGINTKTVYKGHQWDIVQLNDSTFVAVPGLNAGKSSKPILLDRKSRQWDYLDL